MTEAQIELEIAEITTALSHIRKAGQSYTINTGGSTRTVSMADYKALITDRQNLRGQLAEVQGSGGLVMGASW